MDERRGVRKEWNLDSVEGESTSVNERPLRSWRRVREQGFSLLQGREFYPIEPSLLIGFIPVLNRKNEVFLVSDVLNPLSYGWEVQVFPVW